MLPAIQEEILSLPRIERGDEGIHLRELQAIAAIATWQIRKLSWKKLLSLDTGKPNCNSTKFQAN